MPLSMVVAVQAALILAVVVALYALGVRFIGKPMAEFSWRFWTSQPELKPGVRSYLLYPVVHSMHDGVPFSQARFFTAWDEDRDTGTTMAPPIVSEFYKLEKTRKGWLQRYRPEEASRDYYVTMASWWWLPRIILLLFLHLYAMLRHAWAVVCWFTDGRFHKWVVGPTRE